MDVNNEYGCLEMQKALLELMKAFDEFCSKANIKYSLAAGSCIGAVRHKGFIPWDDDLDVFMDRDNYEIFKVRINESSVLSFADSDLSALWIPRVRLESQAFRGGYKPTLDVFIMDNVPDNRIIAKLKYIGVLGCQGMIKSRLTINKGNFILKICSVVTFLLGRFFTTKFKFRLYDSISKIGNSTNTPKVCWYNCVWKYIKYQFNREIVERVERVPFEDITLPVTAGYDHYLSVIYGDYMKMPKAVNRIPKHLSGNYDIDVEYLQ